MSFNSSFPLVSAAASSATALNNNVVTSSSSTTGRPKIVPSHVARIAALPKYLVSAATSSTAAPHHSASSSSRETTAWVESSSSSSAFATPASTRPPSRSVKIHPSRGQTAISCYLKPTSSGRTLTDVLSIHEILRMIAEFTPDLLFVDKTLHRAATNARIKICCQKFLVPCGLAKDIPLTAEGNFDYETANTRLSEYSEEMNIVYRRRLKLIQFSEYTSLNQTVPVSLGIFPSYLKAWPPFIMFWEKDTHAKKKIEYDRSISEGIPSELQMLEESVVREVSFFLAKPFSEIAKLMQLSIEASQLEVKALQLEVNGRIAQDTKFLSRLFRYIFDQILGSSHQTLPYREQLYSMATSFVTHCGTYLTYEDLHYALLIHFQMVLNRTDVQGKDQILQPKLLNSMFIKIKAEKAILDKAKRQMNAQDAALDEAKHPKLTSRESQEPDLTNLKRHLQILLTRYEAHMKQLQEEKRNYLTLKLFTDDLGGESRYGTLLEIIKKHLPDPNSKPKSIAGCCTIL